MKIEANDKEIQDIFSLGYFKIPRFQRPYSWDTDEVESFWNDIINEQSENYFIGSMVVYQTKKPNFGIVDGQQRLTTITLLLSVIRNGFMKLGEDNLAKGVHKYVEKPNIDNENEFILDSETSFPYLQDHIQSYDGFNIKCEVGAEEQKLEKAFDILTEKVKEHIPELEINSELQKPLFTNHDSDSVKKLKDLRDKILSLKLVFIQLDNEDDAYLIFETLNARGRDLATSDLIKNLVLKRIKSKSSALDQAKESWNSIVRQFDDINDANALDSFLLHYWLSMHGYTTDKKLFSHVKNYIGDNEDTAKKFICSLSESSFLYGKTIDPKSASWSKEECAIKSSLSALNSFKVKQQSPMTLSLLRAYEKNLISLKNLKESLSQIETFHYCFNTITSQRSSGSISTNYSRIAISLSNSENVDQAQKSQNELKKFLREKFPEKNEFIVKFKELEYLSNRTKNKAAIRYGLAMLIPQNGNALPVDFESLTIEHLIPQSAIKNGVSDKIVGSIGNLILIDGKTNSEDLRDKSPSEKINILRQKGFPLSENFISSDNWNESLVAQRTEHIASKIYQSIYDGKFK